MNGFNRRLKKRLKTCLLLAGMLLSISVYGQQIAITGTVVDENNEGLPGVNVVIAGTTRGVVTDLDGKFSIDVPDATTVLQISFIGYNAQEVTVGDRRVVNVTLTEASTALDEVVVIGYGTQRKRDLTGAITSVSGKELTSVPVASAAEAMTGKMAGVQVTTTEGSPDAEIKIRVRGGGSITQSSEPLYIVDGFPVSSISDIAAGDIQSIDVLKDASSTAIYGARGANGVVIITTKSGEEGRVTVNYNGYIGYKKLAKRLNVLDPYDYAMWTYEHSLLNDGENYSGYQKFFGRWEDIDMYKTVAENDWQDIIFGNIGRTVNHNLSISGGTDKTRYMFSYNRIDDKAIATGSDFTRNNLSLKLSNDPHKRVRLDFQMRWSQLDVNGPNTNEGGNERGSVTEGRMRNVMLYPTIPLTAAELTDPTQTDGEFNLFPPQVSIRDNDRVNMRRTLNMGGAVAWEFFDGFRIKSEIGLDQFVERNEHFYGVTTYFAQVNVPNSDPKDPEEGYINKFKPAMIVADRNRQSIRNTNTLQIDFKKMMPQDHHLTAVIGQEYLFLTSTSLESTFGGFDSSFDLDQARRLANTGNPADLSRSFSPDDKLLSFFGRVNYDYQSKYLASVTFRADGSSKFAEGNRWGYFPSVSAAWRMSAERFMEGAKNWLYDLKLRASYGTAGNNNIPAGQMAQLFSPGSTSWVGGYSSYWSPSSTMANPDLTWETTVTRNIGLDWALLGGKLTGTFEVYQNSTKDLLLLFPTQGTGYTNQYRNIGETENKGLELSASWVAVDHKNFGVTVGGNISFNKNKVISLSGMIIRDGTQWASTEINNDYIVEVGQPIGQMFGYRSDGRYEVSDFDYVNDAWVRRDGVVDCTPVVGTLRPGSMKLKLKEGMEGNAVGEGDDYREVIGNANPIHTGGFFVNMRAYGFDLSANFNWSFGNDIYNANKIEYTSTSKYSKRNMIDIMADGQRWTNLDKTTGKLITDPAALEAANANTTMWSPSMRKFTFTDWAVEDGSFLRLNTLTLGYTLPTTLSQKIMIRNFRVYATGYNVFCLNNYSGFDPEVDTRRRLPYTPGVDFSAYPRSRQIVFGINVTF